VYVFVRRDLSVPQQAVQACHAAIEAARQSLISAEIEHPHLILFGVHNEAKLNQVRQHLDAIGVRYRSFHEADLNHQLTSVATEPVYGPQRRHFKKYPPAQEKIYVHRDD
jgi:hypothetical protein